MKKGFTLIEILAVIVIMSIITLIAVPVIGNLIAKSKLRISVEGIKNYVRQANNASSLYRMDHSKGVEVTEEKYVYDSLVDNINITVEGKKPTYVYLVYDTEKYTVREGKFCINGFSVDYNSGTTKESSKDYCNRTTIEIGDPKITYENTPANPQNGYLKKTILHLTFDEASYTTNYIRSTVDVDISASTIKSCGSGEEIGECDKESVTRLAAGKWYTVNQDINIIYDTALEENAVFTAMNYLRDELKGEATATVAKIDKEIPTIGSVVKGSIATLTFSDSKSGLAAYCVTKGSVGSCEWVSNETGTAIWQAEEIGTYHAYAKDKVGNISDSDEIVITELTVSYPATPVCSNGGVFANGGCYYEKNQSICGCGEYNSCSDSACGIKSTNYKTCSNSACGVASYNYNTCSHSDCGTSCNTCTKNLWQYCCGGVKQGSDQWCTTPSTNGQSCPSGYVIDASNRSRCYKGADKCYYDYTYTNNCDKCGSSNNSCSTPACGVASTNYNSCATSACGVSSYTYYSCATSGCGCKEGASCTKTEPTYLTWTCPDGGELEDGICIK